MARGEGDPHEVTIQAKGNLQVWLTKGSARIQIVALEDGTEFYLQTESEDDPPTEEQP